MTWKFTTDLTEADVTPEELFMNRRKVVAALGAAAGTGLAGGLTLATPARAAPPKEEPNSWDDITSYNNFYEFGTGKSDPKRYAGKLTIRPWTVRVEGMVDKPGDYDFEDLLKGLPRVSRIYRFRCVEAWSMVVPWDGVQLSDVLNRVGVRSGARYVAFETLVRPSEMPGQKSRILDWPYREGLRLDEAMHPLTLIATGIYGKPMPRQNGAPLRLVVPWKYGFKSIKSIVRIRLTDRQPQTTWNMQNPREYGFYSNVNPQVDHPRWSQATERRIGGGLFSRRIPTLMFNGYADEVAGLYKGMDLRRFF